MTSLINLPKLTFNKPSNWNKLPLYTKIKYYSTILNQDYSIYVDKIEAKKIVTELTNGQIKVAKIIKELKDINDISQEDIDHKYLLKASHGCKWNLDFYKTSNLNDIKDFLITYNKIYLNHEKQYQYIRPRFFIEEKIYDSILGLTGHAIVYMFRCIYGNPVSIGVKIQVGNKKINGKCDVEEVNFLYDTNWNIIDQKSMDPKYKTIKIPKPIKLDSMIDNAKILSNRFEFVRIDYYIDKNHDIYFSEFTFSPNGGNQTFDTEIEYEMSKTWD